MKTAQAKQFLFITQLLLIALLAHTHVTTADSTSDEAKRRPAFWNKLDTAPSGGSVNHELRHASAVTTRGNSEERGPRSGNFFFKKMLSNKNFANIMDGVAADVMNRNPAVKKFLEDNSVAQIGAKVQTSMKNGQKSLVEKAKGGQKVFVEKVKDTKKGFDEKVETFKSQYDLRNAKQIIISMKNGNEEQSATAREKLFKKWAENKETSESLRTKFLKIDGAVDEEFEKKILHAYDIFLGKRPVIENEEKAIPEQPRASTSALRMAG